MAAAGLHPDNADRGASPLERALIVCYIEFDGAVAQLGERSVRNAEVEGSIPFRSIISLNSSWAFISRASQ